VRALEFGDETNGDEIFVRVACSAVVQANVCSMGRWLAGTPLRARSAHLVRRSSVTVRR